MRVLPVRKRLRMEGYDYSQAGYYFVTVCTKNRMDWLGHIDVGQGLCSCRLTDIGIIAEAELMQLENRYSNIQVEKHVIMPNHLHAIIAIQERREQSPRPTTLSDVICAFKSITAKKFNRLNNTCGPALWQSRFHDVIIRSESDYHLIAQYIDENPARWQEDRYFVPSADQGKASP